MEDHSGEVLAFWKAVAVDHRDAFVEAETECERLRRGLRLIADSPYGVVPDELRAIAAAALSTGSEASDG